MSWQDEIGNGAEIEPMWLHGIPHCVTDDCRQYDGKRCRAIGFRPGNICEPAVIEMAALLNRSKP